MPDAYAIESIPAAERDLAGLPRDTAARVARRIDGLASDPRPPGLEPLSGWPGYYRIRIGNYRVVYRIDDATRTVTLSLIGHRRDVYERFERRMRS
jgi:mRNA interferase RelE/StbE